MAEETSEKLRLTVKTTKEKIEVELAADATAKQVVDRGLYRRPVKRSVVRMASSIISLPLPPPQLKEHLSEKRSSFLVAQLCLIFAGRILKDEETLESQGTCLLSHLALLSSLCC